MTDKKTKPTANDVHKSTLRGYGTTPTSLDNQVMNLFRVQCEDCGYWEASSYWDGVLGTLESDSACERAKIHAKHNGHTVFVERSVHACFNPKGRLALAHSPFG